MQTIKFLLTMIKFFFEVIILSFKDFKYDKASGVSYQENAKLAFEDLRKKYFG